MRVGLVSSRSPSPVTGGNDKIIADLRTCLNRAGHDVTSVVVPIGRSQTSWEASHAFRGLAGLGEFEVVITLRWPAHLVRHPRKIVWFQHHYRALFDLLATEFGSQERPAIARSHRNELRELDDEGLLGSTSIWTISEIARRRVEWYNGVTVDHVVPATLAPNDYCRVRPRKSGVRGVYSVCINRVTPVKRQKLAIESLCHLPADYRLVFAGAIESVEYRDELLRLSRDLGVDSRVTFLGAVSERTKWRLLSRAACLVNPAFLEDSHSYPVLEAAAARAPVVVCADGGGLLEFVVQEDTGYIAEPVPASLAAAIKTAALSNDQRLLSRAEERTLQLTRDHHDQPAHLIDQLG